MRRKGTRKHRLPQAQQAHPVSKDNARGVVSHTPVDGEMAVANKEADIHGADRTHPAPSAALSENESLKEQFYDNDSLGG
jgi:hypothetical protein